MELILKETIDSLGREGDIVTVKDGYGRNYLLPQQKAVPATKENIEVLEQNRAEIQARLESEKKEAEKLLKKLAGITLKFEMLAGEDEKLFGSVTSSDILERLQEKEIKVEKRNILLAEPIKTLGDFNVNIKAGFDLTAEIAIKVSAQDAES